MFTKKGFIMLLTISTIVMVVCMVMAYNLFDNAPDVSSNISEMIANSENFMSEEKKYKEEIVEEIEEETVVVSTIQKIEPSTKIVYQYYYEEDDIMEVQEEVPTYFLLDLTLSDMLEYYKEWEIVSFSSREVVMRKNIKGKSNQRYIIGEKDGFVAVFYEEEQYGIDVHQLTDTPVSSLSDDEQESLEDGIFILGNDMLAVAMEGYSS